MYELPYVFPQKKLQTNNIVIITRGKNIENFIQIFKMCINMWY